MDLAIATAVASSFKNSPCREGLTLVGEIGLSGDLRGAPYIEQRLTEALKLGYSGCVLPKNTRIKENIQGLKLYRAESLFEALDIAILN